MIVVYYTDIAVTVFNKCTEDNNGNPIPGGTEVVTKDSDDFMVTFNYEFLEDFHEKPTEERLQRRRTSRRRNIHSGNGHSGSTESDEKALTGADEVDNSFFPAHGSTLGRFFGIGNEQKPQNSWGPEGFDKQKHPLNIMVCSEVRSFNRIERLGILNLLLVGVGQFCNYPGSYS